MTTDEIREFILNELRPAEYSDSHAIVEVEIDDLVNFCFKLANKSAREMRYRCEAVATRELAKGNDPFCCDVVIDRIASDIRHERLPDDH